MYKEDNQNFMEDYVMNYKSLIICLTAAVLLQLDLEGSTTATATVNYNISSIDAISVSGNPGTLTINTATAGSAPTSVTDSSTTYAITTNNTSRNITGALASTMPTGITLSATLVAPSVGTSAGDVALSTTAASLVTGIANISQSSMMITYSLDATVSAAQGSGSNTVTYTIGP
jgi:hypothetical protein